MIPTIDPSNYAAASRECGPHRSATGSISYRSPTSVTRSGRRSVRMTMRPHPARERHERELKSELPKFIATYEAARTASL